jgi:hypothetical protein
MKRRPTEARYNNRIAPNKTINPVKADPRQTFSKFVMMVPTV